MYCELEAIELRVETCPVNCCYKTMTGSCGFQELTDEKVDAQTIAKLSGKKIYKVKSFASAAKQRIEIGLAIDKYADFVRDSYKRDADVVNTMDSNVTAVLKKMFNLSSNQQEQFWSEECFNRWKKRNEVNITLADMRHVLIST